MFQNQISFAITNCYYSHRLKELCLEIYCSFSVNTGKQFEQIGTCTQHQQHPQLQYNQYLVISVRTVYFSVVRVGNSLFHSLLLHSFTLFKRAMRANCSRHSLLKEQHEQIALVSLYLKEWFVLHERAIRSFQKWVLLLFEEKTSNSFFSIEQREQIALVTQYQKSEKSDQLSLLIIKRVKRVNCSLKKSGDSFLVIKTSNSHRNPKSEFPTLSVVYSLKFYG